MQVNVNDMPTQTADGRDMVQTQIVAMNLQGFDSYNGPVTVNQSSDSDLVPTEAQYMVTMQLMDDAAATRPMQRGIVQVEGKPESVLSGLWRQTLKVLVRESGV